MLCWLLANEVAQSSHKSVWYWYSTRNLYVQIGFFHCLRRKYDNYVCHRCYGCADLRLQKKIACTPENAIRHDLRGKNKGYAASNDSHIITGTHHYIDFPPQKQQCHDKHHEIRNRGRQRRPVHAVKRDKCDVHNKDCYGSDGIYFGIRARPSHAVDGSEENLRYGGKEHGYGEYLQRKSGRGEFIAEQRG